jgi:phosphoribosylformimino-5-aminoimidazole carboxamide ribonucleotide (ProFAR) isomerase
MRSISQKVGLTVIVAGNVRSFQQIIELKEKKIWGFIIGGAILEKKFINGSSVANQVNSVLKLL